MGLGIKFEAFRSVNDPAPLPFRASAILSTAHPPTPVPSKICILMKGLGDRGEMNGSPATPPLRVSEERAIPTAPGLDEPFSRQAEQKFTNYRQIFEIRLNIFEIKWIF
jgi:hypothetical protein